MENKINFQLQKIYADGSSEAPMLYSIEEVGQKWAMGRRGFLTASVALCCYLGGCTSIRETTADSPEPTADSAAAAVPAATNTAPALQVKKVPETITGICCQNASAHRLGVPTLIFTPDGRYLVSAGKDKLVKFWEIPSGKLIGKIPDVPTQEIDLKRPVYDVMVVAGSGSDGILRYNLNTGEKLENLKEDKYDYVKCLAFNQRGDILASGRSDKSITLWRLPDYKIVRKLRSHRENISSLAFSPNGRYFASGDKGHILLWSTTDWTLVRTIQLNSMSQVNRIIFSPDSRVMVTGATFDNNVRLWNVPAGTPYKKLPNHEFNLSKVFAFSPNGKFLATATSGNKIHVWDVSSGQTELILQGQQRHDSVESLVFSPDGKYLISGGSKKTIKVWTMPSGRLLTCLFDPDAVETNIKTSQYQIKNEAGQIVTFTLPCGSPLPPNAICTCNCVPGTWTIDRTRRPVPKTSGGGSFICTCDTICTCIPISF